MSIADHPARLPVTPSRSAPEIPPLENGDKLDQKTFHARYEAMPENVRAELIGGIVYMASPVGRIHGKPHAILTGLLVNYSAATPGVEPLVDSTAILGDDSEPQPDVSLRIIGGQTKETSDGYIAGSPELVCEIASSSESIDLNAKKRDYEQYGAKEYLAVTVRLGKVFWFIRNEANQFVELPADADGILRSRIYPGLWLDPAALLAGDLKRVLEVLNQGLATSEHAAFAAR
jgi:Uma2 family endonuclease